MLVCLNICMITIWFLCLTLALAPLYVVRFIIPSVPLIGEYPTTLLEILVFLTTIFWVLEKLATRAPIKTTGSRPRFLFRFVRLRRPILPLHSHSDGRGFRSPGIKHSHIPNAVATTHASPFTQGPRRAGQLQRFCGFLRNSYTKYQIRDTIPIFLFILAGVVSVFVSSDKRNALGSFKSYIAEPILIHFIIKDVVKTEKALFMLLYSLLFSGLWLSVLAVFQSLFGWFVITPHEMSLGRAHGVYNTANALGLYLGPLIMLAVGSATTCAVLPLDKNDNRMVAVFVQVIHRARSTVFCSLIGISVLAIIFSKSAGALVGLVTTFALFVLFALSVPFLQDRKALKKGETAIASAGNFLYKNASKLPWVLFLLTFLFVWLVVPCLSTYKASPPIRVFESTIRIRLCLWEGARNLLATTPLLGSGLSGFKKAYTAFRTCDDELLEYPHNIFLNFWTEMGVLGLISFLWICTRWFQSINTKYQILNTKRGELFVIHHLLLISFLVSLVYTLVHGLVDVPYFKNDLALEFWVLLALSESSKMLVNHSKPTADGCQAV